MYRKIYCLLSQYDLSFNPPASSVVYNCSIHLYILYNHPIFSCHDLDDGAQMLASFFPF